MERVERTVGVQADQIGFERKVRWRGARRVVDVAQCVDHVVAVGVGHVVVKVIAVFPVFGFRIGRVFAFVPVPGQTIGPAVGESTGGRVDVGGRRLGAVGQRRWIVVGHDDLEPIEMMFAAFFGRRLLGRRIAVGTGEPTHDPLTVARDADVDVADDRAVGGGDRVGQRPCRGRTKQQCGHRDRNTQQQSKPIVGQETFHEVLLQVNRVARLWRRRPTKPAPTSSSSPGPCAEESTDTREAVSSGNPDNRFSKRLAMDPADEATKRDLLTLQRFGRFAAFTAHQAQARASAGTRKMRGPG